MKQYIIKFLEENFDDQYFKDIAARKKALGANSDEGVLSARRNNSTPTGNYAYAVFRGRVDDYLAHQDLVGIHSTEEDAAKHAESWQEHLDKAPGADKRMMVVAMHLDKQVKPHNNYDGQDPDKKDHPYSHVVGATWPRGMIEATRRENTKLGRDPNYGVVPQGKYIRRENYPTEFGDWYTHYFDQTMKMVYR